MTTLTRAVLRGYDAGVHKADVQLATSLPTHLTGVPVATDIPAAECIAGRECAVLLFDDNPDNAVVITIHGAVPAGGGGIPAKIQDTDADTYIDTEQTPGEDKIRLAAGSTLRYLIQNTSPHHDLTGDLRLTGNAGIGAVSPKADTAAYVGTPNPVNTYAGLHVDVGTASGVGANTIYGVTGRASAGHGSTLYAYGLDYIVAASGSATAILEMIGCQTQLLKSTPLWTLADYYGFRAKIGTGQAITNWHGFYVPSMTLGVNRRAFWENGRTGTPTNADGNRFRSNTQFGSTTGDFGGGDGVIGIAVAAIAPTTNPTGGVILYVDPADNRLKARGQLGTVTTLANP